MQRRERRRPNRELELVMRNCRQAKLDTAESQNTGLIIPAIPYDDTKQIAMNNRCATAGRVQQVHWVPGLSSPQSESNTRIVQSDDTQKTNQNTQQFDFKKLENQSSAELVSIASPAAKLATKSKNETTRVPDVMAGADAGKGVTPKNLNFLFTSRSSRLDGSNTFAQAMSPIVPAGRSRIRINESEDTINLLEQAKRQ